MRITEGPRAGKRFGNVASEWQRRLILAIWGHRDEYNRWILRRVILKTSRKSGKALLASVLALVELLHGSVARVHVLMLVTQRNQSRLCFSRM